MKRFKLIKFPIGIFKNIAYSFKSQNYVYSWELSSLTMKMNGSTTDILDIVNSPDLKMKRLFFHFPLSML